MSNSEYTTAQSATQHKRSESPTILKTCFTLMELVAAIAILSLIIGIVIGRFRRMPTKLSLENCVNSVSKMMTEASSKAIISGEEIKVIYDDSDRRFYISSKGRGAKYRKPIMIMDEFELEVLDDQINTLEFVFYPDGTANAPVIYFKLKELVMFMEVSPLTGIVKTGYKEE